MSSSRAHAQRVSLQQNCKPALLLEELKTFIVRWSIMGLMRRDVNSHLCTPTNVQSCNWVYVLPSGRSECLFCHWLYCNIVMSKTAWLCIFLYIWFCTVHRLLARDLYFLRMLNKKISAQCFGVLAAISKHQLCQESLCTVPYLCSKNNIY